MVLAPLSIYVQTAFPQTAVAALALPGTLEKFKKIEEASEQIVASVKSGKLIDKIIQVFSSQVVVSEFSFESIGARVQGVLDGDALNEAEIQELFSDAGSFVEDTWTLWLDTILNMTPFAGGLESLWVGVLSFVEGVIERVAAVEFSVLVGIGERWLIFFPLVAIPMWWQMSRLQSEEAEQAERVESTRVEMDSRKLTQRARVQRKLRRMEAMAAVQGVLEQLGEGAFQPNSVKFASLRREASVGLSLLQELNPRDDPGMEFEEVSEKERESILLEGPWRLAYLGDLPDPDLPSVSPLSYQGILALGLKIYGGDQTVHRTGGSPLSKSGSTQFLGKQSLVVGVEGVASFICSLEGKWETAQLGNSKPNFLPENVSVEASQMFGSALSGLLPAVNLAVPAGVQQRMDYELLYLDDNVRVDKDSSGALVVFCRG